MFADVPVAPPDALFDVNRRFKEDTDPNKVGLGVGAYRDDNGQPYILATVTDAERVLLDGHADHEYSSIDGEADFRKATANLLFGDLTAWDSGRVASCQTVGGTGSLRLVGEFLHKFTTSGVVYVSDPTWPNHFGVFRAAGFEVKTYPYWDSEKRGVHWSAVKEAVAAMPPGSIFVVHMCSHNPTGADLTTEQWDELAGLCKAGQLVTVFDCAYHGYASGDFTRDAYGFRHFVSQGLEVAACYSFSKNFGLYGERLGCLLYYLSTKESAQAVHTQLKAITRAMVSNSPIHGSRIVATILSDPALKARWEDEVMAMATRIKAMRQKLLDELTRLGTPGDWTHIVNQVGMFSYTGLTEKQCEDCITKHHVYMFPKTGRMSVAGLTSTNVPKVAAAIHDVLTNP